MQLVENTPTRELGGETYVTTTYDVRVDGTLAVTDARDAGGPKPLRTNYGASVRSVRVTDPAIAARRQETYGARCERERLRDERRSAKSAERAKARAYRIRERQVIAADARRSERQLASAANDYAALADE
jgi:hypothetical protein